MKKEILLILITALCILGLACNDSHSYSSDKILADKILQNALMDKVKKIALKIVKGVID